MLSNDDLEDLKHLGETTSRIVLHWTYLDVALDQLAFAESAQQQLDALGPNRFSHLMLRRKYRAQRSNATITALVFSAMMLEAYINNVINLKLSGFYQEKLDALNLTAKWVIVPTLAYGTGVQPGTDLFQRIDRLQKRRNVLVHARPHVYKIRQEPEGPEKFRIGLDKAKDAIQVCLDAAALIAALDPKLKEANASEHLKERDGWAEIFRKRKRGIEKPVMTAGEARTAANHPNVLSRLYAELISARCVNACG